MAKKISNLIQQGLTYKIKKMSIHSPREENEEGFSS